MIIFVLVERVLLFEELQRGYTAAHHELSRLPSGPYEDGVEVE